MREIFSVIRAIEAASSLLLLDLFAFSVIFLASVAVDFALFPIARFSLQWLCHTAPLLDALFRDACGRLSAFRVDISP